MSRDQLKKLNSGSYKYANPYSEVETKSKNNIKSIDNGKPANDSKDFEKNAYIYGRLADMQKQIDSHKYDIVTILRVISDEMDEDVILDIRDIRQLYSDFRAAKWHVLNRLDNKIELINNFKTNLDEQ